MAEKKKSRLAEIYKAEKSRGGNVVSALGKAAIEKIDPRQFFNQTGFLAAVLPSLFKAYKVPPAKALAPIRSENLIEKSSELRLSPLENKLDMLIGETSELKTHAKISAKNSLVLPYIARDMNVLRLNIQKLVRLQGGTATKGSDAFFKRAAERETLYESQFKKNVSQTNITSTKPTPVEKTQESDKGLFGNILNFFKGMLGTFLKGAGLVALVAGIGKILENPETRETVKKFLSDTFTSVFNGLKEIIKISGEALSDPKTIDAIVNVGVELFTQLKNIISNVLQTEVETPLGKFSIGGILATTVAAFAGFKIALIALEASIAAAAARIAAGGAAGGAAGKAAGGLPGRILKAAKRFLPYALIGGALYYINKETGEATPAPPGTPIPSDAKELTNEDFQTRPEEITTKSPPTDNLTTTEKVVTTAALATGGAMAASAAANKIPSLTTPTSNAVLDAKTISAQQLQKSTPTTKWQKFLQFLATKDKKLMQKVGVKLAQATALAALPVVGWVGAAANLGLSAYTMYEIYKLWKEFNEAEGTPLAPEETSPGVNLISPEFGGTNVEPITSVQDKSYEALKTRLDKVLGFEGSPIRSKAEDTVSKSVPTRVGRAAEETSPGVNLISPEFGVTNVERITSVQEVTPNSVPTRVGRAGQAVVSKPTTPMKTTPAEFQKTDKDTRTVTSPKPGEYGQEQRFPPQPEPSESLIEFIKKKEGFSSKATWDYQQYSNGYGTKANSPNEVIDEKEADARARKHISEVYKGVLDYTEKNGYKFNQNQIEALTSFSYNFGLGRLKQLTDNGKRDAEEISKKMVEYVNVRKKNKETGVEQLVPEPGLITRRIEEQALFNTPVNVASLDAPRTRSMTPVAAAPAVTPVAAAPAVTPVAAAPAIPSKIQTVIKSDGSKLGAATIEIAQARIQIGSTPVVVPAPAVNIQAPQVQTSMTSLPTTSSIIDSEFMKLLVGRTVTL